jgi:hypothetical protein
MTVWKSVGRSRYKGDTHGVEQFLQEHAASRILDLIEIVARQPGCRRMTVNEGRRTRPRQDDLWRRWKNGTGYLAAVPYTSRHDEERHGNAADLGGPDGEPLNLAERAAISRLGPAIGVRFTGLTFRPAEPWHVEADETPYTRRYGTTAPAGGTAVPITSEEDDDPMKSLFIITTNASTAPGVTDTWLVNAATFEYVHIVNETQRVFWAKKGAEVISGTQPSSVLSGFTAVDKSGGVR